MIGKCKDNRYLGGVNNKKYVQRKYEDSSNGICPHFEKLVLTNSILFNVYFEENEIMVSPACFSTLVEKPSHRSFLFLRACYESIRAKSKESIECHKLHHLVTKVRFIKFNQRKFQRQTSRNERASSFN